MKRFFGTMIIVAALIGSASSETSFAQQKAAQKFVSIGTAGMGGTSYIVGAGFAMIFSKEGDSSHLCFDTDLSCPSLCEKTFVAGGDC